jgi:hypothetical protein
MNIFVLDKDPIRAAQYHCDKHSNRMLVESCQLLATAHYDTMMSWQNISDNKLLDKELVVDYFSDFPRVDQDGICSPYALTHYNHPCAKWVRESIDNYNWLCQLALNLAYTYTERYGKTHSCEKIVWWYIDTIPELPLKKLTPFVQVVPDDCKDDNAVEAYRNYYRFYKHFACWKYTAAPWWWQ